MNWINSKRFAVRAQIVAVAALAVGFWSAAHEAQADTGSVFEEPTQQVALATSEVSGLGSYHQHAASSDSLLILAQAASSDEESAEGEEAAEEQPAEVEGPPESRFWVVNTLRKNPMLTIFLTLAIGYWVGALKFGSFSLGSVTGVLLAGIVVGQLTIDISPHVKTMFFLLFLFAVGYGVGPQFVRGIAKDGVPQAIFAAVICLLCLFVPFLLATIAGYGPGLAAGMYAGSQTISASIGLATDAINTLGLDDATKTEELNRMPVGYAVCYIFGTVGTGWILAFLGPKMIGADIQAECKRYEEQMSEGAPKGGAGTAWHQLSMRTFEISQNVVGKTVAQAEATVKVDKGRVFIEGLKRGNEIIEFEPTTVLQAGDIVAVGGPTPTLIEQIGPIAKEVAETDLLTVPIETVDMVVTKKAYDGKTIMEMAKEDFTRGVHLNKITRGAVSVDIPILAQSQIYRGDILSITGTKTHTNQVIKEMGYADRPSNMTDMVWVGIFIVLGGLFGALSLNIGGAPITLSVSGGALIAGIILGWLRGVRPTFGQVPAPSLWFMNSVGLNVFIAVVGISAGPTFIAGLREAGIGLFILGLISTSIPMLLAPYIGKFIFKFDPAINLGCCGGARTSTASVAMVGEVAKSNVPMLGYTVPYAVSNTLLTIWGLVIVLLIA